MQAHLAANAPLTYLPSTTGVRADIDERRVDHRERLPARVQLLARVVFFLVTDIAAVPP